ncbi:MAG: CAP domain-containing protein [Akkermansiaceae bacterium]
MKSLLVTLAATIGLLSAQEPEVKKEAVLPAAAVRKALQWMQDRDPEKRDAAYRSFQLYGGSARDIYRATLEKAQRAHEKRLDRLLNDEGKNPYLGIDLLTEELNTERERILALIHTDFKKAGDKVRMLRSEVEKLERLNERIRKTAKADSRGFDQTVSTIAIAMAEVQRELRSLDEEDPSENPPSSAAAQKEALNESFDGEVYLKTREEVDKVRREITLLGETNKANSESQWANSGQKEFARIINSERTLFGISPLLLEERLSAACTGHSVDMATLGFFAHESPVEGKKSPWDRARVAGFQHRAMGENIFMGSSAAQSAYKGWFGSDGHRFIMFGKRANLLGAGPHGRHWTMMTGRK